MRLYDISRPLSPKNAAYPGDPPFRLSRHSSVARGDPFTLTSISLSSHLGTHVDAPNHFIPDGATVDTLPLESLIGPAVVRDFGGCRAIGKAELESARILGGAKRLLLRTEGARALPENRWPALTEEGALWIVGSGIVLVGIDAPSIDPPSSGDFPGHRALLSAGVVIIEGLDLRAVPPGDYTLYCLPLKVVGAEGAPARVILVEATDPLSRPEEPPGEGQI